MSERDDESFERRREDQENARWRGAIDARLHAVEDDVRALSASAIVIDRSVTRMEGRLEALQRELNESRVEVRQAARQIDKGREDAVTELKKTISGAESKKEAWQFTRFQVAVGAVVAIVAPAGASLIVLAITGQLQ